MARSQKSKLRIYSSIFTSSRFAKGVIFCMRSMIRYRVILVWLAVFPLSGCLFRSRKLEQPFNCAGIQTATQQELVGYINTQAALLQSLQATVDIDTTVGGAKKGQV